MITPATRSVVFKGAHLVMNHRQIGTVGSYQVICPMSNLVSLAVVSGTYQELPIRLLGIIQHMRRHIRVSRSPLKPVPCLFIQVFFAGPSSTLLSAIASSAQTRYYHDFNAAISDVRSCVPSTHQARAVSCIAAVFIGALETQTDITAATHI